MKKNNHTIKRISSNTPRRNKVKMTNLHNSPSLGMGIYNPSDIRLILKIPQRRIRRYITDVWDNQFGKAFGQRYSWDLGRYKAVNFLVLIEFKVVHLLLEEGIPIRRIFKARQTIAKDHQLAYPFANSKILFNADRIWYEASSGIIDADGSGQLNFDRFVTDYAKMITYNSETQIATSLRPDGFDSNVIVDPAHQFGQPVILDTNIPTETIYRLNKAGDRIPTLQHLYNVSEKDIRDAIAFHDQRENFREAA